MLHGVIPILPFLDTDLTHPNPIIQIVDTEGGRVTNIAVPGHVFYPGTVHTQVTPIASGTSIETIGTGTGKYPWLNVQVGILYFGTRNHLMAMGCEAVRNPLNGPMFDLR